MKRKKDIKPKMKRKKKKLKMKHKTIKTVVKSMKMKRKKKKMMRRKKEKPAVTSPWGGHMPFPPLYCAKKEFIFMHMDVPWIDLCICVNCKEYPNGCDKKNKYLSEMNEKRKEYFNNKKGEKNAD